MRLTFLNANPLIWQSPSLTCPDNAAQGPLRPQGAGPQGSETTKNHGSPRRRPAVPGQAHTGVG